MCRRWSCNHQVHPEQSASRTCTVLLLLKHSYTGDHDSGRWIVTMPSCLFSGLPGDEDRDSDVTEFTAPVMKELPNSHSSHSSQVISRPIFEEAWKSNATWAEPGSQISLRARSVRKEKTELGGTVESLTAICYATCTCTVSGQYHRIGIASCCWRLDQITGETAAKRRQRTELRGHFEIRFHCSRSSRFGDWSRMARLAQLDGASEWRMRRKMEGY